MPQTAPVSSLGRGVARTSRSKRRAGAPIASALERTEQGPLLYLHRFAIDEKRLMRPLWLHVETFMNRSGARYLVATNAEAPQVWRADAVVAMRLVRRRINLKLL